MKYTTNAIISILTILVSSKYTSYVTDQEAMVAGQISH